jgi:DNA-binding NtrC family response regulator
MAEILVVDDEIGIRELLREILGDEGHEVMLADSARQARELVHSRRVDLVLLDIWMPDTDGVTLLREWSAAGRLTMPVIMMSGHATIDTAVEATRIGAVDFLEKPITMQRLLQSVETGLGRLGSHNPSPAAGTVPAPAQLERSAVAVSSPAPATVNGQPAIAPAPPSLAAAMPEETRSERLLVRELPIELPLRDARDAFERAYFEHHLLREQGSMTRVAERTGLERTHLYRKLKQLGIDLSRGAWRKTPN